MRRKAGSERHVRREQPFRYEVCYRGALADLSALLAAFAVGGPNESDFNSGSVGIVLGAQLIGVGWTDNRISPEMSLSLHVVAVRVYNCTPVESPFSLPFQDSFCQGSIVTRGRAEGV